MSQKCLVIKVHILKVVVAKRIYQDACPQNTKIIEVKKAKVDDKNGRIKKCGNQ